MNNISQPRPFHLMAKPIGPKCNIDCKYCYYLDKEKLYPDTKRFRMEPGVLKKFIEGYIHSQLLAGLSEITFAWQGGEPTMLGLNYFKQIIQLQKEIAPPNTTIHNTIQTNGLLIDQTWIKFLKINNFLVGLSLDGPADLHDCYRVDRQNRPTHHKVMNALHLLQDAGIEYNILTVVHAKNVLHPERLYRFLRDSGAEHIQLIPLIERLDSSGALALPNTQNAPVTEWSVSPEAYGAFLCEIFDQWYPNDIGRMFINYFEAQIGIHLGMGSTMCWFAETCGQALAIEHNGDLYSCDQYVYPEYMLGNIGSNSLAALSNSPEQHTFGNAKQQELPGNCRSCDIRAQCNGGCPKHRFLPDSDGSSQLNYLCASYKKFWKHAGPKIEILGRQLVQGYHAPLSKPFETSRP